MFCQRVRNRHHVQMDLVASRMRIACFAFIRCDCAAADATLRGSAASKSIVCIVRLGSIFGKKRTGIRHHSTERRYLSRIPWLGQGIPDTDHEKSHLEEDGINP